jgi:hypothetical protein
LRKTACQPRQPAHQAINKTLTPAPTHLPKASPQATTKARQATASIASCVETGQLRTPYRPPQARAGFEPCLGSLRHLDLEHMLISHQNLLRRVVTESSDHVNGVRPNQGIGQRISARFSKGQRAQLGKTEATAVLNGLHHSHSRVSLER